LVNKGELQSKISYNCVSNAGAGSGTLEVIEHALKPLKIKMSELIVEMQLGSTKRKVLLDEF
jgi:hypothetical protein